MKKVFMLLLGLGVLGLAYFLWPESVRKVRLPAIISDHMVLQQGQNLPIWGWAPPGEKVVVSIGEQTKETTAAADSSWQVQLAPLSSDHTYEMTVQGAGEVLLVKDILVGETWLASGQSNMEWSMELSDNPEEEIAQANYGQIRLFTVAKETANTVQKDCQGEWVLCSPETVAKFSAVAYHFGKEIHKEEKVPVGLINTSWGGTPAEAWTSQEALQSMASINAYQTEIEQVQAKSQIDRKVFDEQIERMEWSEDLPLEAIAGTWDFLVDDYQYFITISVENGVPKIDMSPLDPPTDVSYEKGILSWTYQLPAVYDGDFNVEVKINETTFEGTLTVAYVYKRSFSGVKRTSKDAPAPQLLPFAEQNIPARLYNAMIHPLAPFALKGAIWYQGESNTTRANAYHELFSGMIQNWRSLWGQGEFPFYFVQIAPFKYDYDAQASAPHLREAQFKTLSTKNTGMVVITDLVATVEDIHPTNKKDVGKRLAAWALAHDYGHPDLVHSGPLYRSMKVEDKQIRLTFDHVGSGLRVPNAPLTHFRIAGKDQEFVEAEAKIDGNTILVWNESIANPVSVRFAWSNTAEPNLFNKEGFPASPFRTDDW